MEFLFFFPCEGGCKRIIYVHLRVWLHQWARVSLIDVVFTLNAKQRVTPGDLTFYISRECGISDTVALIINIESFSGTSSNIWINDGGDV